MPSKLVTLLRSILVSALSLVAAASVAQTTIHVGPGQTFTTIQSGIDAAVNGDTVLVAPGTYYENIDFKGKAITVTSSGGAAGTTIDGGQSAATVVFTHGEPRASVLSGLTITGGKGLYYTPIGGIYLANSSPTIQSNTIIGNQCYGINSQNSSPLILENEISFTHAVPYECSFASGAGIWLDSTLPSSSLVPEVFNNTIENNTESGLEDAGGNGGAGIAVWGGSPTIASNIIRNNATGKYFSPAGGGEGGGIYFESGGSGLVINNLIYGNTSNLSGGGIYIQSEYAGGKSNLSLINNTIVGNSVVPVSSFSQAIVGGEQLYYQAIFTSGQTNLLFLENNIVGGSTLNPSIVCYDGSPNAITYSHNDFYNATGPVTGIFGGGTCTFPIGTGGNISVSPAFASQSSQDYHLTLSSPAVDSGDNGAIAVANQHAFADITDLGGATRVQSGAGKGCVIDIGAYEYPGSGSQCGTQETLTSSSNPASAGQTVTFTAQLNSAAGIPTGAVQFLDGAGVVATEPVSGTGSAAFSTSSLAVGSHAIGAKYQPTGVFDSSTASLTEVITGYATNTVLTCQPGTLSIGGTALLTATVTSSNGTPSGSIAFTDNGAPLGTEALSGGTASLSYTGAVAGTHTITAAYNPAGPFSGSSGSCSVVVNPLPTVSVLSVTPARSTYGGTLTLTATVSPATPPGPGTPTGTVTFYNSSAAIGTGTLAGGVATLAVSNLPGGSDTLTCSYAGSSIYESSNCNGVPVVVTAAATALTLSSSSNPAAALSPVTLTARLTVNGQAAGAGNTIALAVNGQTNNLTTDATGSVSLTTATLTPGSYPVMASFAGNGNLGASAAALTEIVNSIATSTALTAAPNPAYLGQTVTMVATVSPQGSSATATGGVNFYDGATLLGTEPVTAGTATFSLSTLSAGSHPIAASFVSASNVFTGSTSPVVDEVILPSGFTIALSPGTITLGPGATGTVAVQLASVGNFAGPLALSYGTLPSYATASIRPATVTLTQGGSGSATLTLDTLLNAANAVPIKPGSKEGWRGTPVAFAGLLLLLVPAALSRRNKVARLLGLAVVAVSLQAMTGCVNAWHAANVVAPGTYQLPVTATDVNHNSQTATLTVIVTP